MHRGHHEANQSRARVVSAPRRNHEPHQHEPESAGSASSMAIDIRVMVMIYTRDQQSALPFVDFLSRANPAESQRP